MQQNELFVTAYRYEAAEKELSEVEQLTILLYAIIAAKGDFLEGVMNKISTHIGFHGGRRRQDGHGRTGFENS